MKLCPICGGECFTEVDVLWPELVSDWQLGPHEADYINRQQGLSCATCGNNLRSMALAKLIVSQCGFSGTLLDFVSSEQSRSLRVLEINEAGGLTPTLSQLPHHILAVYPEVDIHRLPYDENSFDLIIHSDTLEHVDFPVAALSECARVLSDDGACLYTVPIVIGRLTRSRVGLADSFHGSPEERSKGLKVVTEFGADFWVAALQAGFGAVGLHALDFPAGLAIAASQPKARPGRAQL